MTALPVVVMPDVPLVVRHYLLTVPALTAIVGDRISTALPPTPRLPCLTLQRMGGNEVIEFRLDRALLDLHSWGATQAEASLLARTARAALKAARGWGESGVLITSVGDALAPVWQPDPDSTPPTPRYVATMAVTVRPNP